MSYIKTGDIENKISLGSLNNGTVRNWGNLRVLAEVGTGILGWKFGMRFREGELT
jgi:hypothetical protein